MQAPTERHLLRRQQFFGFVLQDILYQAYQRALQVSQVRRLPTDDFSQLFRLSVPDISRADNESLARSARDLAGALASLARADLRSPTLAKLVLRTVFKFAGEPQSEDVLDRVLAEMG
jgi:hypothetical protein